LITRPESWEEVILYYGQRVLEILSPDDLLRQLPTEAILSYVPTFDMAAHVIKSGMKMYLDTQRELLGAVRELTHTVKDQQKPAQHHHGHKPPMPMPRPQVRLPRVTVVGLLPIQQSTVRAKLKGRANFNFVDKNRKPDNMMAPDNQDIILLAANFINHAMQDAALLPQPVLV
jgi:hypothetical protein